MADISAEATIGAEEFFAELNRGQKFVETTLDGRRVDIRLRTPHIENVLRASDLFDALDAGLDDVQTIQERLIRLACRSCVNGVEGDNVAAFLNAFPPAPKIVIEALRLLRVEEDGMRRVGINPEGGLTEPVPWTKTEEPSKRVMSPLSRLFSRLCGAPPRSAATNTKHEG